MIAFEVAAPLVTGFVVAAVPAVALVVQRAESRSLRARLLRDAQICQQLGAGTAAREQMEKVLEREVAELDVRAQQASAGGRGPGGRRVATRRVLQVLGLILLVTATVLLVVSGGSTGMLPRSLGRGLAVIAYAASLLCLLFAAALTLAGVIDWTRARAAAIREAARAAESAAASTGTLPAGSRAASANGRGDRW
ncbi:hypothetical protein [Kineococcus sp. SYSU DK006]|uniref:hypothetical protein n=1 Tax=Kineococcus sp. SYSU DK006 TaxID=3383127 RepID=UPI003D7EF801